MYDSRTDHADYYGPRWETDEPWHYRNAHPSRSYKKFAKRYAAKKDRRSANPRTSFRGYGWGTANYKYNNG